MFEYSETAKGRLLPQLHAAAENMNAAQTSAALRLCARTENNLCARIRRQADLRNLYYSSFSENNKKELPKNFLRFYYHFHHFLSNLLAFSILRVVEIVVEVVDIWQK
jgi:hypothetical protein